MLYVDQVHINRTQIHIKYILLWDFYIFSINIQKVYKFGINVCFSTLSFDKNLIMTEDTQSAPNYKTLNEFIYSGVRVLKSRGTQLDQRIYSSSSGLISSSFLTLTLRLNSVRGLVVSILCSFLSFDDREVFALKQKLN